MKSLRFREKSIFVLVVMVLVAVGFSLGTFRKEARLDSEVMAAVSNPTPASPGYSFTILPIIGSFTTTSVGTNIVRFKMPWDSELIGASAIVKTTGSGNTVTFDVEEAGTSVLSAPITAHEYTVTEGTISDSAIADEAIIGVKVLVSGTGTATNPTVQLNFKRK